LILPFLQRIANIADYYLALRYIIGLANNDYGREMNWAIGMEMMLSFLSFGNLYAFKFVEMSFAV